LSTTARETGRWEAKRDGRRIAVIRCVELEEQVQVECEVFPPGGGTAVEAAAPAGPYRFPTAGEARRFIEEALLSLEYLGCEL
jgi:hypothetical protein